MRAGHLRRQMISVAFSELAVIEDVAGRLFQISGEPAPLEHLGEDVRRLFAGQMHAAQLSDRIVSVLEEHPVVEILGTLHADEWVVPGLRRDGADPHVGLVDELVQEETPDGLGGTGVPGEQSALHHFRHVDEGEHRSVDVGEESRQHRLLVGSELFAKILVLRITVVRQDCSAPVVGSSWADDSAGSTGTRVLFPGGGATS